MKPLKGGGYERLAFRGDKVVEARNMKTGATHSAADFAADRRRKKSMRGVVAKHLQARRLKRSTEY